ncbi:EthD family reductase [Rhodovibrionaceae bacterium A322]
MGYSLQVLYPVTSDSTFDYDYYTTKHMDIVGTAIGPQIEKTVIIKGGAGPDGKQSHHAIATIVFADKANFEAAMASIGPAAQDIPNFYNGQPQMVFGEVIG